MITRPPREARQRLMLERCGYLLNEGFVRDKLMPLLPEVSRGANWSSEVVRNTGPRLTVRYKFENGTTVYGKAYSGHAGARANHLLINLWERGFGAEGNCHVPEPLGFLESSHVLLMREARGKHAADLLAGPSSSVAVESARGAALWLVKLHAACIPGLPVESEVERLKLLKELDVFAAAAAAGQGLAEIISQLLRTVRRAASSAGDATLCTTHGGFKPSIVFQEGQHVTAIDLDTLAASDPARDVATFITRLKWRTLGESFRRTDHVECLAREFLEQYRSRAGNKLASLAYYMTLYITREFVKAARELGASDWRREELLEFCCAEVRTWLPGGTRRKIGRLPLKETSGTAHRDIRSRSGQAPLGVPLSDLLRNGDSGVSQGILAAANLLVAFHSSGLRLGDVEPACDSLRIFNIADTLVKCCAKYPGRSGLLYEIVYWIKHKLELLPGSGTVVQTHGSFRPRNVLITPSGPAAAIGLDRCRPANPAKDVASFVSAVCSIAFRRGWTEQKLSKLSGLFLDRYLAQRPEVASSLAYYQAAYLVLQFLRRVRDGNGGDPAWTALLTFYNQRLSALNL